MTVSSRVSSIIYVSDGQNTNFDVPFRFLEDSDLQLSIQATDGTVTNLVLNSDYTVTGANADNGGKVYLTHPAPAQSKLSILRVMNLLQETDYRENERFPAESHERALDKLTMEVQQLQEQSDRAIKVDVFSDVDPDEVIGLVERVYDSIDNIDIVANDKANIDTVATNINSVNINATNMAAIQAAPIEATNAANSATASAASAQQAATSANNSHIWAEGTDAQVQALGGVHSSKVWAEQSTNANIALTNSPYTTNRILEIPQDIKLELNNGTLTLKAGSKLYYPDGFESDGTTPKFYEYIVPTDYSFTGGSYGFTDIHLLAFGRNQSGIDAHAEPEVGICYSGTTAPTNFGQYAYWWDLSTNRFKWTRDSGSTWDLYGTSLPVALFHYNKTDISGIDQVFNGFGYIGSTVFALPGVKVQIPNGRNEDGTLKSIEHTNSSVITTQEAGNKNSVNLVLTTKAIGGNIVYDYDEKTNYCFRNDTGAIYTDRIIIGKISVSSGKITSIETYTVDSVVNSNEFYQLKDKAVTTDTAQTISGVKTFSNNALQALRPVLLKEDNANEGGQIHFQRSNNSVLKDNPFIDLLINTIRFIGVNSNNTVNITLQVDLENNWVFVPTPEVASNNTQAATTAWVNSKMQVVSAFPANPDPNVFYFIPE